MKKVSMLLAAACTMLVLQQAAAQQKKPATPQKDGFQKKPTRAKHTMAKEAIEFEFRATRDPRLNVVPRERLMTAYREVERRELAAKTAGGGIAEIAVPGITWAERGPNNVGGRTRGLLVSQKDATGKTVFAGGVDGGLWRCNDITLALPVWTPVNDFFTNMAITSIAQKSAHPDTMYFCTGEGWLNVDAVRGLGVWRSTNAGTTWTQLAATNNNSNFYFCQKVVVNAQGHVFAGTSTGLWKSTNAGSTWTNVNAGFIADIEIASTGRIHVAKGRFGTAGGYQYSDDGGTTWTTPAGFGAAWRVEIAVAPNNANILYAMCETSGATTLNRIMRSTNAGATWANVTLPVDADPGIGAEITRGQAWYDLALAVDPLNANTVYCGGIDLFKSTNGGTSWTQISHWYGGFGLQYCHADQHTIAFRSGSSSEIYFGHDGGVFRTANGTAAIPTLTERNTGPIGSGYRVTQFYACAISPTLTNYFLAGSQDNGTVKFTAAGINNTTTVTGGDGGFCHIDQNNNNNQLSAFTGNNVNRSTDGGTTWGSFAADNTGMFINPSDLDNTNDILYSARGANEVLRWNAIFGATSKTILTFAVAMNGAQASHIKVSPNTPTTIYVGTTAGRVVRITGANGAAPVATSISTGLPAGYVSCIDVQPGNENHLLVSYSNYGLNSVWESTNGGTTWTNRDNATLPDMPVRWCLFNRVNTNQAFLATELGVWSCDNLTAPSWGQNSTGLGNVRVDMLEYRASDRLLAAATHGRGLYTTTVPLPVAKSNSDVIVKDDAGTGPAIEMAKPREAAASSGNAVQIIMDNNSNRLMVMVPNLTNNYVCRITGANGVVMQETLIRGNRYETSLAGYAKGVYVITIRQKGETVAVKQVAVM